MECLLYQCSKEDASTLFVTFYDKRFYTGSLAPILRLEVKISELFLGLLLATQ